MGELMELIRSIRNARSEHDVEPGRRIAAIIAGGDRLGLLQEQAEVLLNLARIDEGKLLIERELEYKPDRALTLVVGGIECYLPLADLVDLDRERTRLEGELEQLLAEVARSERLLSNRGFVSKAPPEVVQKERDKLADHRERAAKLRGRLESLS